MSAAIVLIACPPEAADRIGRTLVEERLAACVQAGGVRSTYRWKGAIETAEEVLLLCKTTRERTGALSDRAVALHPYDVPEVLTLQASDGHGPYLDWLAGEATDGTGATHESRE